MAKKQRLILRGSGGPKVTFKKHPNMGYLIYVKYFMAPKELVGSVRRGKVPSSDHWNAYHFTDLEVGESNKVLGVLVSGADSRKRAVRALMVLVGV